MIGGVEVEVTSFELGVDVGFERGCRASHQSTALLWFVWGAAAMGIARAIFVALT